MPDLSLEVATPDRLFVNEKVSEVEVPGKDGYMGILPGHAPLISELAEGVLRYVIRGKSNEIKVSGGFVEIRDDKVQVLADTASVPDR